MGSTAEGEGVGMQSRAETEEHRSDQLRAVADGKELPSEVRAAGGEDAEETHKESTTADASPASLSSVSMSSSSVSPVPPLPQGPSARSQSEPVEDEAAEVVGAAPAQLAVSTRSSRTPPRPPVSAPSRSNSWSMQHYLRSNSQINRLVQAALLKTLLHAIRSGSVEGVRVAIERGVHVQYRDSRQRNLIMFAIKCDTDARLAITVILADAGCDIDHADQVGWNCLHYACASGAMDVAGELVRRGARVQYNPYGYGPEDFVIPKVIKAKSLLQHTEQLQHEKNVKDCWDFFRRHAELATGYVLQCRSHCDLGKPLKVSFQAPVGHSPLDRIRVVDMNSDVALWLQASKTFPIPPGTITLDVETLDRPSLYRIFYEKYEPTPVHLPAEVMEQSLSIKNLDTGTTVSMGSVNDLVLKELESTRASRKAKKLSNSSRRCRHGAQSEHEQSEVESEDDDESRATETTTSDTITVAKVEDHPTVHSITGVYRIVAATIVSVSTLNSAKANEYQVTIKNEGAIGLHLAASVNPGDCLVAIGAVNIEHAGLKHTLWELNAAPRPLTLRFRRGTSTEKKSLFSGIRKMAGVSASSSATISL
ncbi:hypothetical protein ATCC90586_007481 [Pythium insidiosum]|nr:hypothetical protein ATCC90586_007481 [Pythium insidiosum]